MIVTLVGLDVVAAAKGEVDTILFCLCGRRKHVVLHNSAVSACT